MKIKGSFSQDKFIEGIYYNPDGIIIYEGEFKNENPKESNNIIIYDDDGNKIYEGEIHNGLYEGKGIEYCPILKGRIVYKGKFKNNIYELPDFDLIENKNNNKLVTKTTRIVLLSHGDVPGKTCLCNHLLGCDFYTDTLATIGFEKNEISYENKNTRYKLIIFDTAGGERFLSQSLKMAKTSIIALYLFDLSNSKGVSIDFIKEIKEINNNIKIYIVGNKLDLFDKHQRKNKNYLEKNKNSIIDALKSNLVDKYFEVSAKTREGIDKLMHSIKYDSLKYLKRINADFLKGDKNIEKRIRKKLEKYIIY